MLSLVVDDEPSIRYFVRTILQRENFDSLEADGGNQALEIVERLGGALDLIVTDVRMPGGDGLAFAHAVRTKFPRVPIILISAHADPDGSFEFVEKPFQWATLEAVIRRITAASEPRP